MGVTPTPWPTDPPPEPPPTIATLTEVWALLAEARALTAYAATMSDRPCPCRTEMLVAVEANRDRATALIGR